MSAQLGLFAGVTRAEFDREVAKLGHPPGQLPLARKADPFTSHAAAVRAHELAALHEAKIIAALATSGTIHELAARTGLDPVQVGRRMKKLQESHRAAPTTEKRPSPSGRPCRVWRRT